MQVRCLGWEDPLGEEIATHSSILAGKIPWTEEPGRLQSVGRKELDTTERRTLKAEVTRLVNGTDSPRKVAAERACLLSRV